MFSRDIIFDIVTCKSNMLNTSHELLTSNLEAQENKFQHQMTDINSLIIFHQNICG